MTNPIQSLEEIFWEDNDILWEEITRMWDRVEKLRDSTLALATKYENEGEWGLAETVLDAFLVNSAAYEKFLSPGEIKAIRKRWEEAKAKHKG